MSSIANTSSFLQSRARAAEADQPNDPETRLLQLLDRLGVVSLTEVPRHLDLSPEQALPVVSALRDRGQAEVLEKGGLFLRRR